MNRTGFLKVFVWAFVGMVCPALPVVKPNNTSGYTSFSGEEVERILCVGYTLELMGVRAEMIDGETEYVLKGISCPSDDSREPILVSQSVDKVDYTTDMEYRKNTHDKIIEDIDRSYGIEG